MVRDSILIVEDVEINRLLLSEIFQNTYNVIEASDGVEALEILKEKHMQIAAILLDLEMPVMNGFEFLEKKDQIADINNIPIIVVTVDDTNNAQLRALECGALDIVKKPYNPLVIKKRVKNAINLFSYHERLQNTVEEQSNELEAKEKELNRVNENLVDALSSIVEFRDVETGEHVKRIKDYTKVLCYKLIEMNPDCGISTEDVEYIVRASAMHDIGKISIPDAILLKPGRLSVEEFDVIKTHTTKGAEILDSIELLNNEDYVQYCRNIILYHHEKFDGKGYPMGLSGETIPIEAQIVSIADVFDALVSKRIYKDAYSAETAKDMIIGGECGCFSERLLECFEASFDEFKKIASESFANEMQQQKENR